MLSLLRERLTLVLLALLPLHAFAVTVLTKVWEGGGESPLAMIAIWKEILLLLILLIAFLEIIRRGVPKKFDVLDILIVVALLYSGLIHLWSSDTAVTSYIYGFRYDFVPLIAFLILRRVQWSAYFLQSAMKVLIGVGSLVALYGFLTLFLPEKWFALLGYSALHSLYIPDGPIAAFQYISESGIRRIQSTFSGPNQLGLWLLIPFAISLRSKPMTVVRIASVLIAFALFFTFSRAAWIGAVIILVVFLGPTLRRRALIISLCTVTLLGVIAAVMFPSVIVRSLSSSAHITRPLAALQMIAEKPLGYGLGSAGPASNRTSDACIELPLGSDYGWTEEHPNLCVFLAGKQVLPFDRTCNCPVLPENWYLQWGVEMGLLGLLVSLFLPFFVLKKLKIENGEWKIPIFASFLALSVAALFLHAFEDSAVSYTLWILLSATLPLWKVQTAPSSSSTSADNTRT